MNYCVSGRVPPRLVYLWSRIGNDRAIQVVFEWEATWPEKYVIECHEGPYIVARSKHLAWVAADSLLNDAYAQAGGQLFSWYTLVLSQLQEKGGSIED